MRHKIIQIILLSVVFIYLFHGFDIKKIDFNKFSFFGMLTTFVMIFISQLILSLRWMKMSNLSFKVSFETIIVSSVLNMILPAKLGELSKALYLKKFYKYNYHRTLSIIFVERFLDVIMLFLLLCIWAYDYTLSDAIKSSLLILSVFIIIIVFFFNSLKTLQYIKKIPLRFVRIYLQKIYKIVHKMFKAPLSLSFYTVLLWLAYFFGTYLFFAYAVHFHLNIMTILGLFIFSTIALALPLAPAGVGTYEAAVVFYLSAYGVSKEDALLAATIYHILLFAVDFLLLYFFLLYKNIKFKELVQQ